EVFLASTGAEGLEAFVRERPDVGLLDGWMPGGMDGIETLQRMKQLDAHIPIVIMSGHTTIETAVRATKLGAFDFLEKPRSLDKIVPMLDHAKRMQKAKTDASAKVDEPFQLIGGSELLSRIRRQIDMVAPRNAWVLITGENGTGKE